MLESLPESISTFGGAIDGHMALIYWLTGIFFVIAEGVLIYLLIRYRRRKGVRAAWAPGDTKRSNAWILVPAVFVLAADLWIEADSARVWYEVKQDIPENPDVLVRITAAQYAWFFTYAGPDGKLDTEDDYDSAGVMRVPRGKVVRFQLESEDVLHSFFVPELRLKQDAVPGRSIPGWFEATKEGSYEIACAELCGPVHGGMKGELKVVAPENFDSWTVAQVGQ